MQRKRPLPLMTPSDAPGGGVDINGTRIPQHYETSPVLETLDQPPTSKRSAPMNPEDYPYYADQPLQTDSWVRGYEREMQPMQFSGFAVSSSAAPVEYDYSQGYSQAATAPVPLSSLSAYNLGPKRKLTCELPWPALPDKAPNSKFGLGLDRYGHEQPSPMMEEFQDTVKEMQNEIAFLKRHPEVASRIPHAVRILEKECFKLDKCVDPEWLEVDINKPINLVRKVLIPTNRHPQFNFIGKIIGNRGTTLQNLGKQFKCHINLCGEGSSRDRRKEAHLLATNNEKYLHYGLPLYIQISTIARPHVAFMRLAGFLNVLHKLLIPSHDIHLPGITDGNTWFESGETYVYEPIVFDETADEEKETELWKAVAGYPSRGRGAPRGRGGPGASRRGGPMNSQHHPKSDDYSSFFESEKNGFMKSTEDYSSASFNNGGEDASTHVGGGEGSSRGTPAVRGGGTSNRGRGRGGRGAVPINRT